MKNGFEKLEINYNKQKEEISKSIKKLAERMKKQNFASRAFSPSPEIDTSAILSKRYEDGSKCVNCDKNLGQLDRLKLDFNKWKKLPRRQKQDKSKMLHMGKGYSKLLQSCNFSPDGSFKNDDLDASNTNHQDSTFKTIDRELDPSGLQLNTKKLPQIKNSASIPNFDFRHI